MKAVLISIHTEWCDLIARGEKTLEVRKSRPKLETPFKCYIYRTKGTVNHIANGKWFKMQVGGMVIGEFTCDAILPMSIEYSDPNSRVALKEFPGTCLSDKQIVDYLGNGATGYGWHISDLKIYDRLLSNICKREELKCSLRDAKVWVRRVDAGLAVLEKEELDILHRFYITPERGIAEKIAAERNVDVKTVYRRKDAALRRFTLALYGMTES